MPGTQARCDNTRKLTKRDSPRKVAREDSSDWPGCDLDRVWLGLVPRRARGSVLRSSRTCRVLRRSHHARLARRQKEAARRRISGQWTIRYCESLEPDHDFDLIVLSLQHYRVDEAVTFLAPRLSDATLLMSAAYTRIQETLRKACRKSSSSGAFLK